MSFSLVEYLYYTLWNYTENEAALFPGPGSKSPPPEVLLYHTTVAAEIREHARIQNVEIFDTLYL